MIARAFPRCSALNRTPFTEPRRRPRYGYRCQAAGDGWGGRCRWHGGLDLPPGDYAIVVSKAGIFVWRVTDGELDERRSYRAAISWQIAALLIETGKVGRGLLQARKGQALLRRVESRGVAVTLLARGPVSEYAFRASGEAAA